MIHRTRLALLVPLAATLALSACAATLPVRVLPKGESRWTASIGGPMLPHHVPTGILPYTDIGMMWGKSDDVTLTASVHALAAAFGIAGVDVGAARRLRRQDGAAPEVTGQVQVYAFAGAGGARAYPHVTGTASWNVGQRSLVYGGASLTSSVVGTGAGSIHVSPHLGLSRDFGRRFTLQLEGKWLAATTDTHSGLFEGENSINGRGSLAMHLGVQVKR